MRLSSGYKRLSDWGWRIIPVVSLTVITAFLLSKQIVSPHRRLVKLSVVFALMTLMLRFDMVYSIYLFVFLFPFPSSISVGSTNSILMTLIMLIWFVRANSEKSKFFYRTVVDKFIILLLMAYIVSLFNVETFAGIRQGLMVIWRQLSAIIFFYLIVRFINTEAKLEKFTWVIGLAAGFIFLTGMIELFFPGTTLIPGWIGLGERLGQGTLSYRVEGIRVGGAVASHDLISDYATLMLFFMAYHFIRARNPIWKIVWLGTGLMTFAVLLATANRGAFFGFVIGVLYFLWTFRRSFSLTKYVVFLTLAVSLFATGQVLLDKYTYSASITQRVMATEFEGVVPDTRVNTWRPALKESTKHIVVGHGPVFRLGPGLGRLLWPHNSLIYFLYTLGLLGLTAFLLILYRIFRLSTFYRKPFLEGTNLRTLAAIFHIQLVMNFFEQMRTDHQRDDIYIYVVWMLFGLIVAVSNIIQDREKSLTYNAGSRAEPESGLMTPPPE